MYLWRIQALVNALREAPLTAKQCLLYLTGILVLGTLAYAGSDWTRPWDRDNFEVGFDFFTTLVAGALSIVGLWACFGANGGEAGQTFSDRIIALGFVLAIRFAVFSVLLLALYFHLVVRYQLPLTSYEWLDLLFVLAVFAYWFRLRAYVRAVAKSNAI